MALLKSFGADVLAANVAKRQAYHDSRLDIANMPAGEPQTPNRRKKRTPVDKDAK